MTNGEYASLDEEGHGALWLLGWGLGHPSLDSQFGWDLANAYAVAEIAPQVYRFSGYAGPEKILYLDNVYVQTIWILNSINNMHGILNLKPHKSH